MFTEPVLASIIRFYGQAMQGYMGPYLEKNIQAMTEVQAQLAEKAEELTPEMWARFMTVQSPMLQGLMGNYVEQSKSMFVQMQEQMQKNTEQVLGAFASSAPEMGPPRAAHCGAASPEGRTAAEPAAADGRRFRRAGGCGKLKCNVAVASWEASPPMDIGLTGTIGQ